jgi:hypothetical protein
MAKKEKKEERPMMQDRRYTHLYYPGIDKWVPVVKEDYCEKCGQLYAVHNDDGSCVED